MTELNYGFQLIQTCTWIANGLMTTSLLNQEYNSLCWFLKMVKMFLQKKTSNYCWLSAKTFLNLGNESFKHKSRGPFNLKLVLNFYSISVIMTQSIQIFALNKKKALVCRSRTSVLVETLQTFFSALMLVLVETLRSFFSMLTLVETLRSFFSMLTPYTAHGPSPKSHWQL